MPKRICSADLGVRVRFLGAVLRSRTLRTVATGMRCKAPAIKTRRGAWRCPLHGGLSTGPKSIEGKARISAAARRRWEAYRAEKAIANNAETMPRAKTGPKCRNCRKSRRGRGVGNAAAISGGTADQPTGQP
jgi:hypothetical protein